MTGLSSLWPPILLSLWFASSGSHTLTATLDGLISSLLTAGASGRLGPR